MDKPIQPKLDAAACQARADRRFSRAFELELNCAPERKIDALIFAAWRWSALAKDGRN